jgi:hypothetical protein
MSEVNEAIQKDSLKGFRIMDLNYDQVELILQVDEGKNIKIHSINYDKIQKFTYGTYEVPHFIFFKKVVKAVKMYMKKADTLYVMRSDKIKKFDKNKDILYNFAKKNKILFEE